MHHYGGKVWDVWNRRMREILVAVEVPKAKELAALNPRCYEWGEQVGRIYVTSLSVCTLEVYYRHLPIFEQIDLSREPKVSTTRKG